VLSPEQKLWRAVLVQAYEDAEHGAERDQQAAASADIDLPDPIDRVRARRYLRADNPEEAAELAMVCDYAGLPAGSHFHVGAPPIRAPSEKGTGRDSSASGNVA